MSSNQKKSKLKQLKFINKLKQKTEIQEINANIEQKLIDKVICIKITSKVPSQTVFIKGQFTMHLVPSPHQVLANDFRLSEVAYFNTLHYIPLTIQYIQPPYVVSLRVTDYIDFLLTYHSPETCLQTLPTFNNITPLFTAKSYLIVGDKHTGKTIFASQVLINLLQQNSPVVLLDLDMYSPILGCSGHIHMTHFQPNEITFFDGLSPYPSIKKSESLWIGEWYAYKQVSLYIRSVSYLLEKYKKQYNGCKLLVNTSGSVKNIGETIIQNLIQLIKPDFVLNIYLREPLAFLSDILSNQQKNQNYLQNFLLQSAGMQIEPKMHIFKHVTINNPFSLVDYKIKKSRRSVMFLNHLNDSYKQNYQSVLSIQADTKEVDLNKIKIYQHSSPMNQINTDQYEVIQDPVLIGTICISNIGSLCNQVSPNGVFESVGICMIVDVDVVNNKLVIVTNSKVDNQGNPQGWNIINISSEFCLDKSLYTMNLQDYNELKDMQTEIRDGKLEQKIIYGHFNLTDQVPLQQALQSSTKK